MNSLCVQRMVKLAYSHEVDWGQTEGFIHPSKLTNKLITMLNSLLAIWKIFQNQTLKFNNINVS